MKDENMMYILRNSYQFPLLQYDVIILIGNGQVTKRGTNCVM